MITKAALDVSGRVYEIEWSWSRAGGDWEVDIETVDGEDPALSDDQLEAARLACADAYPLAQYQDESLQDAEYYER